MLFQCPTCGYDYIRYPSQIKKGWIGFCSRLCKKSKKEDMLDIPDWYYKKVIKEKPTRAEIQFDRQNRKEVRAELILRGFLKEKPLSKESGVPSLNALGV